MSGAIDDLATRVIRREVSAAAQVRQRIADIRDRDPALNAVTRLLDDRATADAEAIDRRIARGEIVGPLAGVPFGVKDLFDLAGLPTTAGSALRRSAPVARRDAEAVRRLRAAGAVPIATLNMDEFAYGFVTVNAHYGTTRNPHDPARLAGGSSGGSAAAVAAGLLPFTLGSDTNGSIRVPAALCGVYGLRPTHGTLPMGGVAPFVRSFDDIGPFTANLDDLKRVHGVLSGGKSNVSADADTGLRVGRLAGWFARNISDDMAAAIEAITDLLNAATVEIPDVATARSAAFLMTAAEGGALHLDDLRHHATDYDPATRDRLIAGAMLPIPAYQEARRFRVWFRAEVAKIFRRYDVLIAPTVGDVAPLIDHPTMEFEGALVPARSHLGIFTQPLSFIGLPVIAAPLSRPDRLPLGIQLVGPPGGEARLFSVAEQLRAAGLII